MWTSLGFGRRPGGETAGATGCGSSKLPPPDEAAAGGRDASNGGLAASPGAGAKPPTGAEEKAPNPSVQRDENSSTRAKLIANALVPTRDGDEATSAGPEETRAAFRETHQASLRKDHKGKGDRRRERTLPLPCA